MLDLDDEKLKEDLKKFAGTLSGIKPTFEQLCTNTRPKDMPKEEFRYFKNLFDGYMKARKQKGEVFWDSKKQGTYIKDK